MYRTRSSDGGRTWSKPAVMAPNGVMPRLLRLGNGMLVLSSGRPGVQLRFSKSGLGDDWSEPVDVLPPTSDKLDVDSCGYTGLVALDRDTFLIVYSWFQKPDADGRAAQSGAVAPNTFDRTHSVTTIALKTRIKMAPRHGQSRIFAIDRRPFCVSPPPEGHWTAALHGLRIRRRASAALAP